MVMTSDDVTEPGATGVCVGTISDLYVVGAQAPEDAVDWINVHPPKATEVCLARKPPKDGINWVERRIRDPSLIRHYSTPPPRVQAHADFIHDV
jgi:hypothetical protein